MLLPLVSSGHAGIPLPDEALTLKGGAALLELAGKTVDVLAVAGELPAFKVRGPWRIQRAGLAPWIDAQPRGGERDRGNDDVR